MKTNISQLTKTSIALAVVASLAACGGGGSAGTGSDSQSTATFDVKVATDPTVSVAPGFTTTLYATAATSDAPLKSLAWSITNAGGAPTLGLANGNCASGSKTTNQKSSAWDCLLSVTAPVAASAPTTYTLLFTATDMLGNTRTVQRNVAVSYDPSYAPPVDPIGVLAMPDFSVLSGATAPLSCPAASGTTLSWSIKANGNLPINLTSYNTAQTTFVAPTVAGSTSVLLTCTTIDNTTKHVSTGDVTVTILPPASPIASSVTISAAQSIVANAVATATVTVAGISVPLYYQWTVVGSPSPSVTLGGDTTNSASFVAPTVATPTTYVLKVVYGLQPITSSYTGIGQAQTVVVVHP